MACTVGEIICPHIISGIQLELEFIEMRAVMTVMCPGNTCLKYLDIPFINSSIKCYLYEEVTGGCVKEN